MTIIHIFMILFLLFKLANPQSYIYWWCFLSSSISASSFACSPLSCLCNQSLLSLLLPLHLEGMPCATTTTHFLHSHLQSTKSPSSFHPWLKCSSLTSVTERTLLFSLFTHSTLTTSFWFYTSRFLSCIFCSLIYAAIIYCMAPPCWVAWARDGYK